MQREALYLIPSINAFLLAILVLRIENERMVFILGLDYIPHG